MNNLVRAIKVRARIAIVRAASCLEARNGLAQEFKGEKPTLVLHGSRGTLSVHPKDRKGAAHLKQGEEVLTIVGTKARPTTGERELAVGTATPDHPTGHQVIAAIDRSSLIETHGKVDAKPGITRPTMYATHREVTTPVFTKAEGNHPREPDRAGHTHRQLLHRLLPRLPRSSIQADTGTRHLPFHWRCQKLRR